MGDNDYQRIESKFKGKDIVSILQFDKKSLEQVFNTTNKIKSLIKNNKHTELLKGANTALIFFEPSSRTFGSFSSAVKYLGGTTLEIQDVANSSIAKGETIEDTIKVLEAYSDVIIIRHPEKGTANLAANVSNVPIINAGDGTGEHPTQAILDLFTIYDQKKSLDNLRGLIVGDLLNGRTVHSLTQALSLFKGIELYLLSPKELGLPKELVNKLNKSIKLSMINNKEEIPNDLDFWYWTRVQKERFKDKDLYEKTKLSFILDNNLIKKKASKDTIFMHPLPRVGEILTEVDSNPNALYLTAQVKNGLYTRMALLSQILGKI